MKDLGEMTRKDFEKLPERPWDAEEIFESLVILPQRRVHDSGYRCLDFAGCRFVDGKLRAVMRLSGCSDVIHFNGIGGYGDDWINKYGTVPKLIPPADWSMDCLKKSGLLRIFIFNSRIKVGPALSSLCIYAIPRETKATEAQAK